MIMEMNSNDNEYKVVSGEKNVHCTSCHDKIRKTLLPEIRGGL